VNFDFSPTLLVFDKDQIAPGKPGFLGMEGDTNNLKVLELRIKCVKWREFRFLSHYAKGPSHSFSPALPPPFEFLHPKWAEMENNGDGLVESVVEKTEFVQMLQGNRVPQEEIDMLIKNLSNNKIK
jgi:hypothetical protein